MFVTSALHVHVHVYVLWIYDIIEMSLDTALAPLRNANDANQYTITAGMQEITRCLKQPGGKRGRVFLVAVSSTLDRNKEPKFAPIADLCKLKNIEIVKTTTGNLVELLYLKKRKGGSQPQRRQTLKKRRVQVRAVMVTLKGVLRPCAPTISAAL